MLAGFAGLVLTATATIASVLTIGILYGDRRLHRGGIGFRARRWGQALYWEISGVIYVRPVLRGSNPCRLGRPDAAHRRWLLATGVVRAVPGSGCITRRCADR